MEGPEDDLEIWQREMFTVEANSDFDGLDEMSAWFIVGSYNSDVRYRVDWTFGHDDAELTTYDGKLAENEWYRTGEADSDGTSQDFPHRIIESETNWHGASLYQEPLKFTFERKLGKVADDGSFFNDA